MPRETWEGVEYAARAVEGGLELSCTHATRSIDREWSVHRTWQRRGGFDRDTYLGAAFMSGLFAAITGGVLLGVCLREDSDTSCAWTAASAPLFADMGYGLIRRAMTDPPKLIGRSRSEDSIALGDVIHAELIACPTIQDVAIGYASGHSPAEALAAVSPQPQRLNAGDAAHLPLAGTMATLTPAVAEGWSPGAHLWAVDANGIAHEVAIDRCAVLQRYVPLMSMTNRNRLATECPPEVSPMSPTSLRHHPSSRRGVQPPEFIAGAL